MIILEKYAPLIKGQIEYHTNAVNKSEPGSKSADFHKTRIQLWQEFLADLQQEQESDSCDTGESAYGLRPSDLEGLPPELLAELNLSEADKAEMTIMEIMESAGGTLSLERILIDYYRKTGEVLKRGRLSQKIYRMTRKGLVQTVEGRKAVYAIKPPENNGKGK